jgi:hypothetical protein
MYSIGIELRIGRLFLSTSLFLEWLLPRYGTAGLCDAKFPFEAVRMTIGPSSVQRFLHVQLHSGSMLHSQRFEILVPMAENDPRFVQGVERRLASGPLRGEALRAADDCASSRIFDCLNLLVVKVSIARPNVLTLCGVRRGKAESIVVLGTHAASPQGTWDHRTSRDATKQFRLDHLHGELLRCKLQIHLVVAIALAML